MITDWNSLARTVHQDNVNKGFYPEGGKQRNVGELIALMHSEIDEAALAATTGDPDDKLPLYRGFDVEIADALIRLLDFVGAHEIDLNNLINAGLLESAEVDPYTSVMDDLQTIHYGFSQMLESHRKGKIIPLTNTPQMHMEAAAVLCVILSLCSKFSINIEEVMDAKLAFNRSREFRHGKAY